MPLSVPVTGSKLPADQKSKIRERYKGIDPDELDVIPALPQEDIFAVENEQRVAGDAFIRIDLHQFQVGTLTDDIMVMVLLQFI